ncbi:MAG: serine--tRNA ligase [Patescibacteria group bacterium]|nr:serine--tRNA ligase [Patescibacteria group bacterium]MCL5431516.1 serine--tRNA ligase [Patescibacteria group bacterium]
MLDIRFIRENPEKIKQNIANRHVDPARADVDKLLLLDARKTQLEKEIEKIRAGRNKLADKLKNAADRTPEKIEEGKRLKDGLEVLEKELAAVTKDWQSAMDWMPNMLASDVPIGRDENDNIEIKAWTPKDKYLRKDQLGMKDFSKQWMPQLDFTAKDHIELGKQLDIIDVEQSAIVSGSRFYYLKNEAALLEYAVFELLKEKLLQEGFTPMIVPLLVRDRVLYGTSHFPGDADQVYQIENKYVEEHRNLFLVGSSEPSLFAYYMDKTLDLANLPQKFFAVTSCFRSEVGSWGKDVRGIKRVHQFDKLEMDAITTPEKSNEMMEYLLSINEWLLQKLELPYHVILMCSGDAGYFATNRKYDFEVWMPVQKTFVEMGSDTNARDFQARRFNTRFIDKDGQKKYVHNVNDTGITGPRTIIAIMENYQNKDGSVTIPKVLQKYIDKTVISPVR